MEEGVQRDNKTQIRDLETTDQFLQGKRSIYLGDYPKALSHFRRCLKENPEHAASMYEISRLYTLKKDYKESIKWAQKAYKNDEENIWYLRHYIDQLKKVKSFEEASDHLEILVKRESNDKQNYYDLANSHIYAKNYDEAIKVYNTIEEKFGFEEGIVSQRKQIYLNQNKWKEALKEVETLIQHKPLETKYHGMKGHIQLLQGKQKEALETYAKILEIDPNDGTVHLALSTLYYSQNEITKAFTEEKIAFSNNQLSINLKVTSLMRYFNKENWTTEEEKHITELLDILQKIHSDEAKTHAIRGDFFIRKKQDKLAYENYKKVLELDSTQFVIWEQCILIQNESKNYEEVNKLCQRALKLFPQHSSMYYFSAWSSYQLKKYNETIEACEMGINFTYKPAQQIDFYMLNGKALSAMGKYSEAIESFNEINQIKVNYPDALAEKAFCQYKQKENLPQAAQDIKTALELDINNQRYFYIYALILAEQNQNDQALHWVHKSITNSSDSEHFEAAGDIYAKAQQRDKALLFYQKAIELKGDKKRIELKMSKLKA